MRLATLPSNMRCFLSVGLEGLRIVFYSLLFLPHEGMYIHYNFYIGYQLIYKSQLRSSKTYKSMHLRPAFCPNANNVNDNRLKTKFVRFY